MGADMAFELFTHVTRFLGRKVPLLAPPPLPPLLQLPVSRALRSPGCCQPGAMQLCCRAADCLFFRSSFVFLLCQVVLLGLYNGQRLQHEPASDMATYSRVTEVGGEKGRPECCGGGMWALLLARQCGWLEGWLALCRPGGSVPAALRRGSRCTCVPLSCLRCAQPPHALTHTQTLVLAGPRAHVCACAVAAGAGPGRGADRRHRCGEVGVAPGHKIHSGGWVFVAAPMSCAHAAATQLPAVRCTLHLPGPPRCACPPPLLACTAAELEETFENLILDQLDVSQYGPALLDPDFEVGSRLRLATSMGGARHRRPSAWNDCRRSAC